MTDNRFDHLKLDKVTRRFGGRAALDALDLTISGGEFHNNWELSAARATAVLEQFLADGIPPRQLSMAGYADQHPIAPNTTADGRALNRRVEVVVTRKFPVPAGATPS